jgi:ATP-binding cassette, subfamily B, bacterial
MSDAKRPRSAHLWIALWRQMARGDKVRLAAAAIVMLLASALMAVLPLLLGGLVDHALSHGDVSLVGSAGALGEIGVLVVVSQLLNVVRRHLVESVKTRFERDTRSRAYHRLMHLDLRRLGKAKIGGVYGRANRSIEGSVRLLQLGAMDLLPAVTLAVAALVVAVTRDVLAAAAMGMVIPTGFALVRWQVSSQAGVRRRVLGQKEEIDGQVVEALPQMETVRAAGAERHLAHAIGAACDALRTIEFRHHRVMSLFDAAKALNEGVWLIATLAVAIRLAAGGRISAGEVTAYVLLYVGVTTPLRELHRIVDEAAESAQQAGDLLELLAEPEDEAYHPASIRTQRRAAERGPLLSMTDVRFAHPGRAAVLSGFSLQLERGERVGLVGATGCGKSTVLKLLTRMLHGYEGIVRIAGRDLRSMSHDDLREWIAYVPQDAQLFHRSVRENIALGHPDAPIEDVIAAAVKASVHADVVAMPDGYDTIVGERGATLSGGQRQRLCLARALLRTPELLLLDESTSALDGPSQRAIQRSLDALEHVSMLVVAHRLTTLRTMDRIVVLERGRVLEAGGFDELEAAGGRFAAMLAGIEEGVSRAPV